MATSKGGQGIPGQVLRTTEAEQAARSPAYGKNAGNRYHHRGGAIHPAGEIFLPVGAAFNPSALVSTQRARPCCPASSANTSMIPQLSPRTNANRRVRKFGEVHPRALL
jgi:hypothetical protein